MMKSKVCKLGLCASLCVLLMPVAGHAVCFFVEPPADGRVIGPYFLNNASNDITLTWAVEAGRSYSVEAMTQQGPSGSGSASFVVNINNSFCPTTDITTGVTIRDTTVITPALVSGGLRKSVVVTTPPSGGFLEIRLHDNDPSTDGVLVSVSETTFYNPRWSTVAGFETQWGFQNTTSATINVSMVITPNGGSPIVVPSFPVPAGGAVIRSTKASDLNIPGMLVGSAVATHDGPPGAILADAYFLNGNATVVVPAEIRGVRSAATH